MHGEVRCKARIILILALAKWQVSGGVFCKDLIFWRASMYKSLFPYVRSEMRVSLLSVKEEENSSLPTSNPRLAPPLNSLSLSYPQPKPGGGSSRAPPARGCAQPRAQPRGGGAQPRGRRSGPRVGLVRWGGPPVGRRRGEIQFWWWFCKGNQSPNSEIYF